MACFSGALYSRALADIQTWSNHLRYVFKPIFLAILAGILALSSLSAFSGERYTEVWNPPEAQTSKARVKTKARNVVPVQGRKKHKNGVTMKKVVDKTTLAPAALPTAPAASPGKPKYAQPPLKLPPLIGPDGRIMRVCYPG
jgi:hypothetical protein